MEVGDLVRDLHQNDLGIVVDTDPDDKTYKIMFHDGAEWLADTWLEVIK